MPCIITTRPSAIYAGRARSTDAFPTRRAVATLDEARDYIEAKHGHRTAVLATARDTDLIGPLPDGTVIEVQCVEWDQLALAGGLTYPAIVGGYAKREPLGNSARQILDAYNAGAVAA